MRTLPTLLLLLLAIPARAATPDDAVLRLLPGQRIAFRTSGNVWVTGDFVTNRNDSLYYRGSSGMSALSYQDIAGLRTRESQRRGGIGVGMLAGSLSLAFLSGSNSGSTSDAFFLGMGGLIVGGFVGGLIGSATHRWQDVFDRSGDLASAPTPARPTRFGGRIGYVTSQRPFNRGFSGSIIVLPGTAGLEISYFPLPADDTPPPTQVYFSQDIQRRGGTLELHLAGQLGSRQGRVRPSVRVGAGPTIDFVRRDRYQGDGFGNIIGVSRVSGSEFGIGLDVTPGVRLGTGPWGIAVEGTYHVVAGRGRYSDFYGVLLGLSRE